MRMKVIALVLFATVTARAQSTVRDLENYFEELEAGKDISIPLSVLRDASNDHKLFKVIKLIQPTASVLSRQRKYEIAGRVGEKSTDAKLRKSVVEWLCQGVNDVDQRVSGVAMTKLQLFLTDEFTDLARERIRTRFDSLTFEPDLAQLAAALGINEVMASIRQAAAKERNAANAWQLQLALARAGDKEAIEEILVACSERKIENTTLDYFIPGLVSTRQKEVFNYLESIIRSDEKGCTSANPNSSDKVLCGYRLMEMLAPVIVNFPIRVDDFGDLDHPDYEQALLQVRKWFDQYPDYEIRKDTF